MFSRHAFALFPTRLKMSRRHVGDRKAYRAVDMLWACRKRARTCHKQGFRPDFRLAIQTYEAASSTNHYTQTCIDRTSTVTVVVVVVVNICHVVLSAPNPTVIVASSLIACGSQAHRRHSRQTNQCFITESRRLHVCGQRCDCVASRRRRRRPVWELLP